MSDRPESQTPFQRGVEIRTAVLGERHVRSNGGVDPGSMTTLHRLVTEFGWGTVWSRDELSRSERSLITLAMLISLNRPHELAIHVRGALRNGLTPVIHEVG